MGYSFGNISSGGADAHVNTLSVRMDSVFTFSPQIDMGLKHGLHGYDTTNINTDLPIADVAIAPHYSLNNGLILGA